METIKKPLTAPELSNLWTSFQTNSLGICVLNYYSAKAEDEEIKSVIDFALKEAQKQCDQVKELLESEGVAIPVGFTDRDVNLDVPRLMTDMFALEYVKHMGNVGMMTYSAALYISSRPDIRKFYSYCLSSAIQIDQKSTEILLSKGIFMQPPYISIPGRVDFVKNQTFLNGGWFGERRPITGLEITNIFINMITNSLGKALIIGFSQVTQSKEIRKYFIRGKQIASKHLSVFGSVLKEEDIDVPRTWDSHVSDSTIAPFSDKLMLFHVVSLNAFGLANYGIALSTSPRRDIAAHYEKLMQDILLYSEDGINLLIKNGWMEEPPKAPDRGKLVEG